jgi:hypothetical protein
MSTKKYKDYTIEEIQKELDDLDVILGRQHGREGKKFDDPEKEKRRLWNNLSSRKSRLSRRNIEKAQETAYNQALKLDTDEADEYGIKPVDERRYVKCFHSGYIGAPVYLKYVKMMTGLTLKQIAILQERTGEIPVPPVTKAQADADEKERWERGDIY